MRKMTMLCAGAMLSVALTVPAPGAAAEMPAGTLEKLVGLYEPMQVALAADSVACLLYTSPSPRD